MPCHASRHAAAAAARHGQSPGIPGTTYIQSWPTDSPAIPRSHSLHSPGQSRRTAALSGQSSRTTALTSPPKAAQWQPAQSIQSLSTGSHVMHGGLCTLACLRRDASLAGATPTGRQPYVLMAEINGLSRHIYHAASGIHITRTAALVWQRWSAVHTTLLLAN